MEYNHEHRRRVERRGNIIISFPLMSLRGGTTKQSPRVQYAREEIAALRSQ